MNYCNFKFQKVILNELTKGNSNSCIFWIVFFCTFGVAIWRINSEWNFIRKSMHKWTDGVPKCSPFRITLHFTSAGNSDRCQGKFAILAFDSIRHQNELTKWMYADDGLPLLTKWVPLHRKWETNSISYPFIFPHLNLPYYFPHFRHGISSDVKVWLFFVCALGSVVNWKCNKTLVQI